MNPEDIKRTIRAIYQEAYFKGRAAGAIRLSDYIDGRAGQLTPEEQDAAFDASWEKSESRGIADILACSVGEV